MNVMKNELYHTFDNKQYVNVAKQNQMVGNLMKTVVPTPSSLSI